MRDLTRTDSFLLPSRKSHPQQVGLAALMNLEGFFLIWWLLIQVWLELTDLEGYFTWWLIKMSVNVST
jgi:hypothetical protein